MNNNDFEFIKNKFDNDNITAPDVLDKDKIIDLICDKKQVKPKFYSKTSFKTIVSLAACFAVVVTTLCVAGPKNGNVDLTESSDNLRIFTSYSQIENKVRQLEKDRDGSNMAGDVVKSADAADIVMGAAETTYGSSQNSYVYARTNEQVEGVSEGDVILNNGKYIFFADNSQSYEKTEVKVFSGTMVISTIPIETDKDRAFICDMYLYDDKLIVNSEKEEYIEDCYMTSDGYTEVFDISDIENPTLVNSFYQSGRFVSTRMIGEMMYLVTNQNLNSNVCKSEEDYAPVVSENGENEILSAKSICCAENPDSASTMVISAVNVATGERISNTKAVFGVGIDLYCSKNNLYIPISSGTWTEAAKIQIFRVSLADMSIATCMADGYFHNQFSMDEHNGYFRIATTSIDVNGNESNNLFVYDSELKKVGEVTGFAKNETIQSVRFIGDMAYVITFEQTDPLFTIDLSAPTSPKIMGELEITGFSSMLYPVDENTILGIGYEIDGIYNSGLKLVLFDISDKANPKALDVKVFKDRGSTAQDNHKALAINPAQGYYLMDINGFDYDKQENILGAVTFSIVDGKINITNQFNSKMDYSGCRATFIDDSIYIIDNEGDIEEFKYN